MRNVLIMSEGSILPRRLLFFPANLKVSSTYFLFPFFDYTEITFNFSETQFSPSTNKEWWKPLNHIKCQSWWNNKPSPDKRSALKQRGSRYRLDSFLIWSICLYQWKMHMELQTMKKCNLLQSLPQEQKIRRRKRILFTRYIITSNKLINLLFFHLLVHCVQS